MDESNALKAWEFDNSISLVDPHLDALYDYSATSQAAINSLHPWRENPHHFTRVRISAVALLKMVMHARSGGSLEVMGLMQGHIANDTFVVTDAFRLPVDGTETRVNAHEEANEYMVSYLSASRDAGQPENAVGWYHSHPGYGCWLSGIDVSTQMVHQKFEDPFLAVVIDPDRTVSAGKVDIGAFRTLPEDYKTRDTGKDDEGRGGRVIGEDEDEYQTIPLSKIEDFGAHSNKYYPLEVSHFKSSLDSKILAQLWNKYWVATLSSNSLLSNRDYMSKTMNDLAAKVRRAGTDVGAQSLMGKGIGRGGGSGKTRGKKDQALEGLLRDSNKITGEETAGLIGQRIKAKLFNDIAQVATE